MSDVPWYRIVAPFFKCQDTYSCHIKAEKGGVARAKGFEGVGQVSLLHLAKKTTAGSIPVCFFWMVFIGNPRSETVVGGGNPIILRSEPS